MKPKKRKRLRVELKSQGLDFTTIIIDNLIYGVVEAYSSSGSADSGCGGGNDCYLMLALSEELLKIRKRKYYGEPSSVINLYFKKWPSSFKQVRDEFKKQKCGL